MNHNVMTTTTKALPALLALAATLSAACLSILAGWQRGGWLAERVLLICIGVVLAVAAHLLPSLCRPHSWRIRVTGTALWIGCMAATCYGHAVFFVMAQKHAGEIRAAVVPEVFAHDRNLVTIASDRADVLVRLARVAERRCGDKCAAMRIERMTLTAQLAVLDAESVEVTRRNLAVERAQAERTAAKADPVAGLLTAFGVTASHVDLVTGMAFAMMLEGVACFCWLLALRQADTPARLVTLESEASHGLPVMRVTSTSETVAPVTNAPACQEEVGSSTNSALWDDVTRVATAVSHGTLRGTVTEIRKHLGCSQAKASAVRKQLTQYLHAGHATTESYSGKQNA